MYVKEMKERFKNQPLSLWSADDIIFFGDKLGKYLYENRVSTSQVRRFIDELQRIKSEKNLNLDRAKFLKVKLVYAVGRAERNAKNGLSEFEECFSYCLENMNTENDIDPLVRFVETVIAYHKYYGGSN